MIVDASAIIAILHDEPDAQIYASAIGVAKNLSISAVNWFEAAIVIDSQRDPVISRRFDQFFNDTEIQLVPVSQRQARIAREAYRDFGKGSGHPAKLNLGDCFAYALAKEKGEPLLFKGFDFQHTDVKCAVTSGRL